MGFGARLSDGWVSGFSRIARFSGTLPSIRPAMLGPLALAVGLSLSSAAFAADHTQFRGVAIGETRQQVETALSTIGRHCMTSSEASQLPFGEGADALTYQLIVSACIIIQDPWDPNSLDSQTMAASIMRLGISPNQIFFENGQVSKMILPMSFFDASRMDVSSLCSGARAEEKWRDGADLDLHSDGRLHQLHQERRDLVDCRRRQLAAARAGGYSHDRQAHIQLILHVDRGESSMRRPPLVNPGEHRCDFCVRRQHPWHRFEVVI